MEQRANLPDLSSSISVSFQGRPKYKALVAGWVHFENSPVGGIATEPRAGSARGSGDAPRCSKTTLHKLHRSREPEAFYLFS